MYQLINKRKKIRTLQLYIMIWHLMCHSSIGAVNYFVNDNIENQLLQII